jgi:hypothetical protein
MCSTSKKQHKENEAFAGRPLVYAFLLSLLDTEPREQVSRLLRQGCHRTVKRSRKVPAPLYRIWLALANLWNLLFLALAQSSG